MWEGLFGSNLQWYNFIYIFNSKSGLLYSEREEEHSEDTDEEHDEIPEEIVSESPDNLSEASNEQLVSELERTLNFHAGEVEKVSYRTLQLNK